MDSDKEKLKSAIKILCDLLGLLSEEEIGKVTDTIVNQYESDMSYFCTWYDDNYDDTYYNGYEGESYSSIETCLTMLTRECAAMRHGRHRK